MRSAIVGARTVLEVGAGRGDLARRLQAEGFALTALDLALPSRDKTSGVTWLEADFLRFESAPFDAVVFTSSLHHLSPLEPAIVRAFQLLTPGGVLVIDDFDLEAPDEATARWYYELQEVLAIAGAFTTPLHSHPDHSPREHHAHHGRSPLERWRGEHVHHGPPLHAGNAMLAQVERSFGAPQITRGPYLYRAIAAGLSSVEVARHVLSVEQRRTAEGSLRAVGLRMVVRRS